MNRTHLVLIPLMAAVLAASILGVAVAGRGGLAGPPPPARLTAKLGRPMSQTAGTGFTYQGQLLNAGSPANGNYDFRFGLWDAPTGGTQVGPILNPTGQPVSGGLFTLPLDFGASAFLGDARWLEIAVQPPGGGGYTTLSPRQPLTAAPYALSLIPGAEARGALGAPVFTGVNLGQGTGLYGAGVSGMGVNGASNSGTGVFGQSNSGFGVFGEGDGPQAGVYGRNTSVGVGVQGQSLSGSGMSGLSTNGNGVVGQGTYGGVFTGTTGIGVRGVSGSSAAVYGSSTGSYGLEATSANSNALYAHKSNVYAATYASNAASGPGVVGFSGTGPGVYGMTGSGLAGRFDGNVQVNGNLNATGTLTTPRWWVQQLFNVASGPLPITTTSFTTHGGTLLVFASGSGKTPSGSSGTIGMDILLDGVYKGEARIEDDEVNSRKAFIANALVISGVPPGPHTITLTALSPTITDTYDYFNLTVTEYPF